MGFLSWIIFGALAGWVASMIAGTNDRQGCILNIIIGIIGAFIGGVLMEFLTGQQFGFSWNLRSFIVAVLGALIFLVVTGFARRANR